MGESCRFWDRDEEKLSRNAGTTYFLSFLLLFDFNLLLLFIISVYMCGGQGITFGSLSFFPPLRSGG